MSSIFKISMTVIKVGKNQIFKKSLPFLKINLRLLPAVERRQDQHEVRYV